MWGLQKIVPRFLLVRLYMPLAMFLLSEFAERADYVGSSLIDSDYSVLLQWVRQYHQ